MHESQPACQGSRVKEAKQQQLGDPIPRAQPLTHPEATSAARIHRNRIYIEEASQTEKTRCSSKINSFASSLIKYIESYHIVSLDPALPTFTVENDQH